MKFLTFFYISITLLSSLHDYYASITDLAFNPDQKRFEIHIELDTEDLEHSLNAIHQTDVHLGESKEIDNIDELIANYLKENLNLQINQKEIELQFEDKEVDFTLTHVYLNTPSIKKKIKNIAIENTLLLEHFPAQQNILHLTYHQQLESHLFNKENTEGYIKLKK